MTTFAAIKRVVLADLDATSDEELRAEVAEDGEDPDAVATAVGLAIARVVHHQQMAQSTAERQKAFKQAMKDAGMVRLEAWVTKEQREKFRQIGGDEWLRKKIDAAKQRPDER